MCRRPPTVYGASLRQRHPRRGWARIFSLISVAAVFVFAPVVNAVTKNEPRVFLPGSITDVPVAQPSLAGAPQIASESLTTQEAEAPLDFSIALRMRNVAELKQRLARGEIISNAEMAEKYFPLPEDYDALAAWLEGEGFTITRRTSSRLGIFARGSVARVSQTFEAAFARVDSDGREFTAAVSPPSVPESLAPTLIGVNGLQPFLLKQPKVKQHSRQPASATANLPPFFPSQIAKAYGAQGLGYDGAGETIGLVMSAFPTETDLVAFWTAVGSTQTAANVTRIAIGTGPTAALTDVATEEANLDSQWSGAMAPAAKIRAYGTATLGDDDLNLAYQQIYDDVIAHPEYGLHQVSLSYGGTEVAWPASQLETDAQYFAQLASAGVTVFASSGDWGSRPTSGVLSAETPASDPSVVGVGGTSISLNLSTGAINSETVWSDTGGGTSWYFPRPDWQKGTGVIGTYSNRGTPDVAAAADPSTGCMIVYNGVQTTVGGTSWSSPTWAGFCALINQARGANAQPSLGLLAPKLYPLLGSTAFRDITSGSNGTDGNYTASTGYDLCTGLGTPNVTVLLQQLTVILTPPADTETMAGQTATFTLEAGAGGQIFQWQREASGTLTWSNLGNDATYHGVFTTTLTINSTTAAMSGDQFRCVVTTANTSITSPSATLVVIGQPLVVTTIAGLAGEVGSADGPGANARFGYPNDVALDGAGNLYIADTLNDTVRRMVAGNVTTLAGKAGVSGTTNGTGANARFNFINSIDLNASGNIFVADSSNNNIRRITQAGVVTTFAGSSFGTAGSTNATGTSARFNFPAGIAVDPASGNIFVADSYNNTIRRITTAGVVTTLAGSAGVGNFADGTGSAARFNFPAALVVDNSGNIFVADANNNVIRRITPAGVVTTLAGKFPFAGVADGTGNTARFNYPSGISTDVAGNLYVTDTNNHSIRKVTQTGVVTTLLGRAGVSGSADGVGSAARFNQPYGIVLDASGNLYIADTFNQTIRKAVSPAAPQILLQPLGQTVLAGQMATFTANASGAPSPSFQWQRLPSGSADWLDLSDDATFHGAHTATLTVNPVTTAMNGDEFRCEITNDFGNVFSSAIALVVFAPPAITGQPQNQIVAIGQTGQFTVTATGLPASGYQWQLSSAGGGGWGNLTDDATYNGTQTATLTIGNVGAAMGGNQFRCLVSNGVNPDAISNAASLFAVSQGYLDWAGNLSLSGNAAAPATHSFNGALPNLARYAMNLGGQFGTGQSPATTLQVVDDVLYLTMQYRQLKSLSADEVVVQYSNDLVTWSTLPPANITQLADADADTAQYEARIAVPPNGSVFLRLNITPAQ